MISLIVCSRISGNKNSQLDELISSLVEHTRKPENVELLIKFDNDDDTFGAIQWIQGEQVPFAVRFINGPREDGYTSIHHGYSALLKIANEKSRIVGAVADDMKCIMPGWDLLLEKKTAMEDFFFVHGRPHPLTAYPKGLNPSLRTIDNTPEPFNVSYTIEKMADLYVIDEAPFWSRHLLRACGDDFLVSFTDCWTLALEKVLFDNHAMNITRFTPMLFSRKVNKDIDTVLNTHRWFAEREKNFKYIASKAFASRLSDQAASVAEGILTGVNYSK